MKSYFKSLKQDKIALFSFIVSLVVFLSCIFLIEFFYSRLPLFVPIYNQLPWGYARLGTRIEFFIPVLIVLIFTILNSTLSLKIRSREPLMSRFLLVTNMAISVFLGIFVIKIIQIIV